MKITQATKGSINKTAGRILLEQYASDGTLEKTIVPRLVVDSIVVSQTTENTEIPDGNSLYPAEEYPTSTDGGVTLNLMSHDPEMDAFMVGSELITGEQELYQFQESHEVAALGVVTLNNTPISIIKVEDSSGNVYTPTTESTPSDTEYKITLGEVTFATANIGKEMLVTYKYTATATSIEVNEFPDYKPARIIICNTAVVIGGKERFAQMVVIDQAKPAGSKEDNFQKDPSGGYNYELSIVAPRKGQKPIKYIWADSL